MDPPQASSFENDVGHFFAKDTFKGKPIVVFRWDARDKKRPVWIRRFFNGKTWEHAEVGTPRVGGEAARPPFCGNLLIREHFRQTSGSVRQLLQDRESE
jgi:hypothetical protein